MSRSALSIVMLLGFVAHAMAGKTMSVTTCGQVVPPGTTATLAKTILCPPGACATRAACRVFRDVSNRSSPS